MINCGMTPKSHGVVKVAPTGGSTTRAPMRGMPTAPSRSTICATKPCPYLPADFEGACAGAAQEQLALPTWRSSTGRGVPRNRPGLLAGYSDGAPGLEEALLEERRTPATCPDKGPVPTSFDVRDNHAPCFQRLARRRRSGATPAPLRGHPVRRGCHPSQAKPILLICMQHIL